MIRTLGLTLKEFHSYAMVSDRLRLGGVIPVVNHYVVHGLNQLTECEIASPENRIAIEPLFQQLFEPRPKRAWVKSIRVASRRRPFFKGHNAAHRTPRSRNEVKLYSPGAGSVSWTTRCSIGGGKAGILDNKMVAA
jgi:hypothetical protein